MAESAPMVTTQPKVDENRHMKAVEWHGKKDIRVNSNRPVPLITDAGDVVLQVTSTAICGSDLHPYVGSMSGMKVGDVMGHEFMGIVHDVGPDVKNVKKGDRVVTCFDIACGQCRFCKMEFFTCCENTNNSEDAKKLFGDKTGGFFGYSHLTGGYPGGQAEYVRVPLADMNTLKVPDSLPDEKVVLLSDILPTAWHANELGEVGEGDVVGIWGCGPVGILAAHCALVRGAKKVFVIDREQYRLDFAKEKIPELGTINFERQKPMEVLREYSADGIDVGIDCVGMHYAYSIMHKLQMLTMLELSTPEAVNEMVHCVRKGGRLSIIGAYAGPANNFDLGAFMEKSQTMRGGQTPVQKYWKRLLQMVEDGELRPDMVITHRGPLEQAPDMYKVFNEKLDKCIKVVMHAGSK